MIPCCYDFILSEIASVSMTNPCGGNIGPPLLQSILFIKYLKMHFSSILKKGRSYVSSARDFHWDGCNQLSVFPCFYFTLFEIITARTTVFSLSLLLYHFNWNHNSMGLVSPPSRTKVLGKFHLFCKNLKYFKIFFYHFFLLNLTFFLNVKNGEKIGKKWRKKIVKKM